jgi:hypothetical protein
VNTQEFKEDRILTRCSSTSESEKTFVVLHLMLSTPKTLVSLVNEWGRHDMFGVRGSMFGDK